MIGLPFLLLALGAEAFPVAKDSSKIGSQEDIFKYLGGAAPYFSFPGDYGISAEIPSQCSLEQVQMFARHGERFPSIHRGQQLANIYYKFGNYSKPLKGDLSFLNDYDFFIYGDNVLEEEVTAENTMDPLNPYTGEANAKQHGRLFYEQYSDLFENVTELPVFTSSNKRVYDTAVNFASGLGRGINSSIQTLSEKAFMGANSLTPASSCYTWDADERYDVLGNFSTQYLKDISSRLTKENKGLNITQKDVQLLFQWCAYEINVRGYSPMCEIFTEEDFIQYSYWNDLQGYYEDGPGNSVIKPIGSVLFNASVELLKQSDDLENKIWLNFAHDTDIENYLATVGLFDNGEELNSSYVPFRDHVYHKAWMVPMGARIYTEKFQCGNESFVRYIVNDAVIPIESCSSGPGFSCPMNDFIDYSNKRLEGLDYAKTCEISKSGTNVTELTFYWDYTKKNYNASLTLASY